MLIHLIFIQVIEILCLLLGLIKIISFKTLTSMFLLAKQGMMLTDENGNQQSFSYNRKLEPCMKEHLINLPSYGANWTKIFDQNSLKDFLCLKLGSDETFQIGGDYTASSFYYLQFCVNNYSNSTRPDQLWRPVCKSEQEIKKYLEDNIYSTINLYFSTVMVNPNEPNDNESIVTYLNTDMFFYLQPTKMQQDS
ncbi:hypothetical protein ABPG72_008331 [Tetrahymena utriculariae]